MRYVTYGYSYITYMNIWIPELVLTNRKKMGIFVIDLHAGAFYLVGG